MAQQIGVSVARFDDNGLTVMRNGMTAFDEANDDVSLQIEDATDDVAKQLDQINNFIASGVDAIIVNAVDTNATEAMSNAAAAAGVPLVYVNRQPVNMDTLPEGQAFVASNEIESGTLAAFQMCRDLRAAGKSGGATAYMLMGQLSNQAAVQRSKDFHDLRAFPWTTVVVGGVDATSDALLSMQAGEMDVTVFQDLAGQGAGSIETAIALINGDDVDQTVFIPFKLVTPDNIGDFLHLLFDTRDRFDSIFNEARLRIIIIQVAIIGIIALGVTQVIITAGIDLSSGSVVGATAMIAMSFAQVAEVSGSPNPKAIFGEWALDLPVVVPIIVGLGVGMIAGLINGFLIAYSRIPPFIATLGMMLFARGVGSLGNPVSFPTDAYAVIGSGMNPVIIFLGLALLFHFIMNLHGLR
ncbi:putative rhizopine-binding protein [Nymphon striatum]|nr:putative rhizopine-binding protein [Nymphon striatum]